MRPKYTNVRARSANVGSGTRGWSPVGPGPACFLMDVVVIAVFSYVSSSGGRCADKILRPDLLDVDLRYTLAHVT
jgi:hypothetical protein